MKAKFTDPFVKNLQPPVEGRLVVTDENTQGLTLRVTSNGVKSWSIQYRPKGQPQRKLTYGSYPAVTLADARARAKAITAAAAVGRDLVEEEAQARADEDAAKALALASARTVRTVVKEYITQHCKVTQRRWVLVEALFDQHVLPTLGDKQLTELRRADVLDLLDDLQHKKGLKTMVNRVHTNLKACLNWAVEREYIDANPAGVLKKRVKEVARDRTLSDAELKAVWGAADALTDPSRGLIKLLILTGQRRDECRCAVWSEIDLEEKLWVLPRERTKNKREHAVPLSDEVVDLLKALPRLGEKYVFTTDGKKPYAGQKRLKEIIDRESGVTGWTLHDLRRTAASGMAGLRISHDVIGKVLNHAKSDVTAKYNRYDYLEEKRAALAAWARHVLSVVAEKKDSKVVQLRS